jgi:acetyl-CoA C-acetyltransferase
MIDPRTPIVVGVGQHNARRHGSEPIALMTRCAEEALADAAAPGLRSAIDAVRIVWGVWPYRDPGRLVATRIGAPDAATTTLTAMGGNQVYELVIDTADRISRGELDVALLCAAETLRTRRKDRAGGQSTEYLSERADAAPDFTLGSDKPLSTPTEHAAGVDIAVNFYAMAETAIRHRNGESVENHRRRIAALWASASDVAAHNPEAWITTASSADQIATESPRNRPIASPYPKLMTANLDVDQGGAVVMCSVAAALAAGVPRERWIFPIAGSAAADHWYATNRWAFDESPAMRYAGRAALDLAGVGVDDCALLDLYSCFPAAVQVAQRELGITADRAFTITGGLTFAAGPLNCYCILPLVRAVRLLRDEPSQRALLTGNGGYFTKHSMLILAGGPPGAGFRHESVQGEVDALPWRATPDAADGECRLETYTVTHDREGRPQRAILACLDADGGRHFAGVDEPDMLAALLADDLCGRLVEIDVGRALIS